MAKKKHTPEWMIERVEEFLSRKGYWSNTENTM